MPVEKESKLAVYFEACKAWASTARLRTGEWAEACRAEPVLIWQTPAIRYGVYTIGGLIALFIIRAIIGLFGPGTVIPQARTADFHVVCTSCGHQFVINRRFGFDDFPVKCPKCGRLTGEHGVRCASGPNEGKWVAAKLNDAGQLVAPACDAVAPKPRGTNAPPH